MADDWNRSSSGFVPLYSTAAATYSRSDCEVLLAGNSDTPTCDTVTVLVLPVVHVPASQASSPSDSVVNTSSQEPSKV